jgi:hypothetical protein
MAVLVPLGLCLVAIVVAALPPADVRPEERGGSWLGLSFATLAVVVVLAFAIHRLRANEPTSAVTTGEVAGAR